MATREIPKFCGDYEYRYCAVRGLERRKVTFSTWHSVDGAVLETLTADELEHCAQVMRAPETEGE